MTGFPRAKPQRRLDSHLCLAGRGRPFASSLKPRLSRIHQLIRQYLCRSRVSKAPSLLHSTRKNFAKLRPHFRAKERLKKRQEMEK